uniref:Uncharacterized protein n=1 Tax=Trypanosoma congolense (strain IL3000) TaxID=1068625 RepID=G0V057_TRYCI|nr:conserved hypothetical protein [Trypanosoma congolense IL3000]
MLGLDRFCIMFYQINPSDYPEYMKCERVSEQPGTVLMESRAMQGIRRTVPIGYLLSVLYFYGYHRPRLSFADREISKLHHYFYPSAGYTTPLGIAGGIAYACYFDGFCNCSRENVASAANKERSRALAAWKQHQDLWELQQASQCWYSWRRLLSFGRYRQGFGGGDDGKDRRATYEDFLDPHGIIGVGKQVPEVNDLSFYQYYNKQQVDALVSAAMRLRRSPEEERWIQTCGRLGGYGSIGMLLTWNSRGMFFRLFMGLGLGVVCGGFISAAKLDS